MLISEDLKQETSKPKEGGSRDGGQINSQMENRFQNILPDDDVVQEVDTVEQRNDQNNMYDQFPGYATRVKVPPLKLNNKSNMPQNFKRPGKPQAKSKNRNRYDNMPIGGFYGQNDGGMHGSGIHGWDNSNMDVFDPDNTQNYNEIDRMTADNYAQSDHHGRQVTKTPGMMTKNRLPGYE